MIMIDEENLSSFISQRITTLRQQAGYTTNGLAYKSGISQSYIRDIEIGTKSNISVEKLFLICMELDITLKDFFDEDFTPAPPDPLTQKIHSLTNDQKENLLAFLIRLDYRIVFYKKVPMTLHFINILQNIFNVRYMDAPVMAISATTDIYFSRTLYNITFFTKINSNVSFRHIHVQNNILI